MKLIKKSFEEETIHSNSIGKVNASFAKFVVDFLSMLLLFDLYIDHNVQAAPAPLAGGKLSIHEQSLLQQNQIVLLKFCLCQNEDVTWKFFGNRKVGTLGWSMSRIDLLWASSVQNYHQFNAGVSSITRITKQHTRERSARSGCGFTTLLSYNCFTPNFVWPKTFFLSTKAVDYLFVNSLTKRLKNI